MRLFALRGGDVTVERLEKLRIQQSIRDSGSKSKKYIQTKLNKAWKELRQVQKKACLLREDHLAKLAEYYAEKRRTDEEIELRKLIHIEQVQKTSAKHKYFLKPRHGMLRNLLVHDFKEGVITPVLGCICFVLMLACSLEGYASNQQFNGLYLISVAWGIFTDYKELVEADGWKNITSEELINKRLLLCNTTHLAQSCNTPFADGKIADEIGLDGEKKATDEILAGNFEVDKIIDDDRFLTHPLLKDAVKAFIKALQTPTSKKTELPLPPLPSIISTEEYKAMFNHTRESTSSMPPIHYGHFKAACESDPLLHVNLTFMNVPFQYGYALTRWRKTLHCMI